MKSHFPMIPTVPLLKKYLVIGTTLAALVFIQAHSYAEVDEATVKKLIDRIERLETRLAAYENSASTTAEQPEPTGAQDQTNSGNGQSMSEQSWVGVDSGYSYQMLDHAENVTNKQEILVNHLNDRELDSRLTIGGQVTALLNYQTSNRDSKFGWLMRHPTSANQIGKTVSEAVIHSANLNVTASLGNDWNAYVEMLFNPEQNFAANSTITGLPRNNVNMRRAYILYNRTQQNNIYASIGKMDIPFGLNDTVSPFTNSASWHAFAGLAYGATLGYLNDSWHARFMAIQGGAQFRNANTPVEGSNVPSRLNNFAVDLRKTFQFRRDGEAMFGLSYQHGSSYCQGWPIKHFEPCEQKNPAFSLYSTMRFQDTEIILDYGETFDEWPGTLNPALPEFTAEEVKGLTIGFRRGFDLGQVSPVDLSFEFSRFESGPSGSEWERVDQFVLGASYFVKDHINIFAELSRTEGWAPLNFLTGGNCMGPNPLCDQMGPAGIWSERDANTNVFLLGVQGGF